jgi:hypothetical protein
MKNLQALYDPSLKFVAIVIFLSLFNKAQLSKIIDPLVLTFQQSLKYYLFNKDKRGTIAEKTGKIAEKTGKIAVFRQFINRTAIIKHILS